jgi:hypothetical protein
VYVSTQSPCNSVNSELVLRFAEIKNHKKTMFHLARLVVALALITLFVSSVVSVERTEDEYKTMFDQWQDNYGRHYTTNNVQYTYRFNVFKQVNV